MSYLAAFSILNPSAVHGCTNFDKEIADVNASWEPSKSLLILKDSRRAFTSRSCDVREVSFSADFK